jgi:uracil phosphoribosyltransferase
MNQLEHHYGSQVHLLQSPFLFGLLAKLCSPSTVQPEINRLVKTLYQHLLAEVMNCEFPTEKFDQITRMTSSHPDQKVRGQRLKPDQKVICVNIARAGTYPSHICFDSLHDALKPEGIRQDHIYAARMVNGSNQVTGTEIGATKIGGDKDKSIVLLPDPMGATGNTMIAAIDYYKKNVPGQSLKFIGLHLIVTPEYLRKVSAHHPEVQIYALRLDRGMSPQAVLNTIPGLNWDQEKGLNQSDYIVPGGGGFGEIMNNSFV